MHSALQYARGYRAGVSAAIIAGCLAASVATAEIMPAAQQNALVQKYCAVCHTDAAKQGGLSLEHFDAAQLSPSLAAMLLSKLTGGVSLESVRDVPSNPAAAALVDQKMKSGAMGAAGIPIPAKAMIDALIHALAIESTGATEWNVERTTDAATGAPMLRAGIVRELPSAENMGQAEMYRLIVSCNPTTHEGSIQAAWSPVAQRGTLAASVDGKPAVSYAIEGSEKMANGSPVVTAGLASRVLAETRHHAAPTGLPLPAETLTIKDLFPGETVVFPFANLPVDARHQIAACFPGSSLSKH